ncbi:MAG: hypothetical protein AB1916_05110 [Thermodesulfobacteriota bacterium]
MPEFILRRTEPTDAAALNALYRHHTGIARTAEQFAWEWLAGPFGPAPSWVLVHRESGSLAAHHGVVPTPLWAGGRVLRAARTENSMVAPEFARQVNYLAHEASLLKKLLAEYDLVFTTTGKGAPGAIRKRLGYAPVGRWRSFVLHEPLSYLVLRGLGRLARPAAALLPARAPEPGPGWDLEMDASPAAISALWEQAAPGHGLCAHRSEAHLSWRLNANPYHRYTLALARKDDRAAGFAAWRSAPTAHGAEEVMVEDLFTLDNTPESCRAVLALVIRSLDRRPARVALRAVEADSALCAAANSLLPARHRRSERGLGAEFLVRSAQTLPQDRPELTMLCAEGIE